MIICPACGGTLTTVDCVFEEAASCLLTHCQLTDCFNPDVLKCWCGEEFSNHYVDDEYGIYSHWLRMSPEQLQEHRALWILKNL
jgi:hypothetical protein